MKVKTYLSQQLLQDDEKSHKVARVAAVQTLGAFTAEIFCRSAHCRRYHFASRVHKQLREPFEHLLDDLRVGLLEVGDREGDANVCYTSSDLRIGLYKSALRIECRTLRIPAS